MPPSPSRCARDAVAAWRVGKELSSDDQRRVILPGDIRDTFARYSSEWSAESILRGKNIGLDLGDERQLDFFDLRLIHNLAPRQSTREKLDRMLNDVLAVALRVYGKQWELLSLAEAQGPVPAGLPGSLPPRSSMTADSESSPRYPGSSDPAEVLDRVESYYGQSEPVLDNRAVWDAVFPILWSRPKFQNLSVEVLAYTATSTRS